MKDGGLNFSILMSLALAFRFGLDVYYCFLCIFNYTSHQILLQRLLMSQYRNWLLSQHLDKVWAIPYLVNLSEDPLELHVVKHDLLSLYSVTEVELRRAKNSTISSVLMNLESRVILEPNTNLVSLSVSSIFKKTWCPSVHLSLQVIVAEDIGRQLLTYRCR